MNKFCFSCGAPLVMPEFKGPVADYCRHCVDEKGAVRPREAVRDGVAGWFLSWQPGSRPHHRRTESGFILESHAGMG